MASSMTSSMSPADPAPLADVFKVSRPAGAAGRFVFASPHSGRLLPADMGVCADLDDHSLHSAEDAFVDDLIRSGPDHGAVVLAGRVSRSYLDLNRAADELDPVLIVDAPSGISSAKVSAGFGVAPRLSGDGLPLYGRRLTMAEVQQRLDRIHLPYHAALSGLMESARARHGVAVLIDWHSMPGPAKGTVKGPDVVLGDRFGTACSSLLTRRVQDLFEGLGWRVALNRPYPGGYSTQTWGRPDDGYQAIQIELSRSLYLDESRRSPGHGWSRCAKGLDRVIAGLCAAES